ncbi:MAG TPA: GNAT family N-acetyltransferase [Bacteroidota bacterium]|nr:GNAT family N-acetyltransferase [Bacteroidota bacterium]
MTDQTMRDLSGEGSAVFETEAGGSHGISQFLSPPRRHSDESGVEIVTTIARLRELRQDWNLIALRTENPLFQFEWFEACAEAFCPPDALHVVVVRRTGIVVGIAPLVLAQPSLLQRRIEILGASVLCEPAGFLCTDADAMNQLISAIMEMRRPLFLGRVGCTSLECNTIERVARRHLFFGLKNRSASPWISIEGSWESYEATLSSSRRSSLRRARRNASKLGTLTTEIFSPSAEHLDRYLDEVFEVESANWKGQAGTSIRSISPLKKFFATYAKAAAQAGILRLCFLRVNGKPIAVQIAVEYARRFWVLKIGYDEEYASCSPGNVLMHDVVRYAFERKLISFEFLGSDEPWLHIWTDKIHSFSSLRLYPPTIPSLINLGLDSFKYMSRRLQGK